jgi:hypothetical protein
MSGDNTVYLVKHLAVLAGETNFHVKNVWVFLEFFDERSHFDGFGTGAVDEEKFHNITKR